MDNYNYPLGADNKYAPWNEVETPEKEIEVCVSIILSKTVKVKVSDYTVESGTDEEGEHFEDIDYSGCDLKKAVEEQITLPQDTCKGWNVDEFEIVLD